MKSEPNQAIGALLAIVVALSATVANAQANRVPVPSREQQQASGKLLEEAYGVSKAGTAGEKQKLVKRLMQEAVADPNLPKEDLYAVLTTVIGLSQSLRDLPMMNDAIERLVTTFDVDASAERNRHLVRYLENANVKTAAALRPIFDEVTALARSVAAENRFLDAEMILNDVDAALVKMKVPGSAKQPLTDLQKEITARKEKYEAFQAARSVLESNPDDPDANFIVGHWLVTEERSWMLALPHLAKSSNSKPWQAAAALELKPDAEPVKVGDVWWELAASEAEPAKRELLLHAGKWYQQALPTLTTLTKKLVEKRLGEIAALPKPEAKATLSANKRVGDASSVNPSNLTTWQEVDSGKSMDLLGRVKLPEHAIHGRWKRDGNALVVEPMGGSLLFAPVSIQGNYELDVEFTRRSGDRYVFIGFPIGLSGCHLILSNGGGVTHGLNYLDGQNTWKHPASAAVFRPGKLQNGHRYKLHIEVAAEGDRAAIVATLDGQRIIGWQGKTNQLICPSEYATPLAPVVSIGANDVATDFHVLNLQLKRGAKAYLLNDDFQSPATQVAGAPPKTLEAKCVRWNGRQYFVSDKPMSITEAQRLAAQLKGRLLTISSAEEQAAIIANGRGLTFWMAGWRRSDTSEFRDERNRLLRFMGNWASGQPGRGWNERQLTIRTASTKDRGWDDCPPLSNHAIIEWGEEYPNVK